MRLRGRDRSLPRANHSGLSGRPKPHGRTRLRGATASVLLRRRGLARGGARAVPAPAPTGRPGRSTSRARTHPDHPTSACRAAVHPARRRERAHAPCGRGVREGSRATLRRSPDGSAGKGAFEVRPLARDPRRGGRSTGGTAARRGASRSACAGPGRGHSGYAGGRAAARSTACPARRQRRSCSKGEARAGHHGNRHGPSSGYAAARSAVRRDARSRTRLDPTSRGGDRGEGSGRGNRSADRSPSP